MEYAHRLNALEKRRTWRLEPDALVWETEGGESGRIPLAEISRVQLSFSPTRTEAVRALLRIRHKRGKLAIASLDYGGPLSAEDRATEFVEFCESLHAGLVASTAKTKFLLGWTPMGFRTCQVFCIVLGIADLAVGGLLWSEGMQVKSALTVTMGLLLLARLWLLAKTNRPAQYDPSRIPWAQIGMA